MSWWRMRGFWKSDNESDPVVIGRVTSAMPREGRKLGQQLMAKTLESLMVTLAG